MKNYFYILMCIFLLNFTKTNAQVSILANADKLYNSYSYFDASKLYDKYIGKLSPAKVKDSVLLRAALSHLKIRNFSKSSEYFTNLVQKGVALSDENKLNYINTLRSVEKYDLSDSLFIDYLRKNGDVKTVEIFSREQTRFNQNRAESNGYKITNLAVNTVNSDFAATFYGNNIVFSSARNLPIKKNRNGWTNQPYLGLYISEANSDGELLEPSIFSESVSIPYHDATIAFLNDSVGYITSSLLNKKKLVLEDNKTNPFKLYRIYKSKGKWERGNELSVNKTNYSTGHPSVSLDKKLLFFSSDMPGGFGGVDIYYSIISLDGTLSSPINAGPKINTIGNDMFPFIFGNNLYFSSDGHLGFGGLDVFVSEFDAVKKSFSEVENVGKPVNSPADDFSFIINENYKGYFSSNRAGGKGDDDIYYFIGKPKKCEQVVTGIATDKLSHISLQGTKILVSDPDGNQIAETETDKNGFYSIVVPCNSALSFIAKKPEYAEVAKAVITGDENGAYIKYVNFELTRIQDVITKRDDGVEQIKINPIYFEYDKYYITYQAETELNKVIEAFSVFPNLYISIESNTDSRGSKIYNQKLSENRAKSTYDYILSKGIPKERIVSVTGYGEEKLANNCTDGVKCSEEEHSKNRRTDFIVIKR